MNTYLFGLTYYAIATQAENLEDAILKVRAAFKTQKVDISIINEFEQALIRGFENGSNVVTENDVWFWRHSNE